MNKTKKLAFPLYILTDGKKPSPNFIADTIEAPGWALSVFSSAKKAAIYAEISEREGARVLLVQSPVGFFEVLDYVRKWAPWVKTMVLDAPHSPRRPKKRFLIPISEYLEPKP